MASWGSPSWEASRGGGTQRIGGDQAKLPGKGLRVWQETKGRHAGGARAQQATLREQEQGHIKAAGGPRVVGAHPPRRPRGGNLLGTTLSLCPEGLRAEASEPLGGRNFLTA